MWKVGHVIEIVEGRYTLHDVQRCCTDTSKG